MSSSPINSQKSVGRRSDSGFQSSDMLSVRTSSSESLCPCYDYLSSATAVLMFGVFNMFLAGLSPVSSLAALALVPFAGLVFEWYNLHGTKLTRCERVLFDEKNLLETTERFEFNLGPVLEDTTPGGSGGGCCGKYPGPTSLISGLFRDQSAENMQKFYRAHYGPVYPTAMRVEAEAKAAQQKNKKSKSIKK